MFIYLTIIPSLVVMYLMLCRINNKAWSYMSPAAVAYLCFLGSAAYSVWLTIATNTPVSPSKLVADLGVFLYFGERSLLYTLKRKDTDETHTA